MVLSNAFPGTDYASPVSPVPQSLGPAIDTVLLPFYTNVFLPWLLHPDADSRYRDFSYTYQLAMDSPTFMNAASACSCMTLAVRNGSQSGQEQAMRFYSKAVSEMREGLMSGEIQGSEDWLLGAVTSLCLFEVCSIYFPAVSAYRNAITNPHFDTLESNLCARTDGLTLFPEWRALIFQPSQRYSESGERRDSSYSETGRTSLSIHP